MWKYGDVGRRGGGGFVVVCGGGGGGGGENKGGGPAAEKVIGCFARRLPSQTDVTRAVHYFTAF